MDAPLENGILRTVYSQLRSRLRPELALPI